MKRNFKKVLSMMLTVIMAISLAGVMPADAATNYVTGTRTVSTTETVILGDEEIEVVLDVTGTPPVNVVRPNDVILLLDKSGSMKSDNRFQAMKESAQEFVDLIDFTKHQVGIVDYSTGVASYPLSTDATAIKEYIANIQLDNLTNTHLGIEQAMQMFADSARAEAQPVILLLTDGAATDSTAAKAMAEAAKDAGIVFYTIALLKSTEDPATSIPNLELQEMATTAHHHHFVLGSVGLIDIYKAIVQEIGVASAYDVEVTETVPDGFEIVAGSYEDNIPRPTVTDNTLTWNMLELKSDTLQLHYSIKLKDDVEPGKYTIKNKISYKDYAGAKRSYTISNTIITVKHKAPVITGVSPERGDIAGGYTVTITGENFRDGATVKFGTKAATDVTVVDSTTITCTAPASTRGSATITVTNDDAQKTTADFTYIAQPVITSISPAQGEYAGGNNVTITGEYIDKNATVYIDGQEATFVSGTQGKTVIVKAPAAQREGKVDVRLVNLDGTEVTVTEGYEYLPEPVVPDPEIISVTPNEIEVGDNSFIIIEGTGFQSGCVVTVDGVVASGMTFYGEETIKVRVPVSTEEKKADVVVTNPDGTEATLAEGITYYKVEEPAPEITSISPNTATIGEQVKAVIEGSNFNSDAKVTIGGVEATVSKKTDTSLTVTVPAGTVVGTVDVVVTNPDGKEAVLADAFTYEGLPAPTITNITVTEVEVGTKALTYIEGTGFQDGLTLTIGGQEAVVVKVYSEKKMYAYIPASDVAGLVDVTVTNPDGQSVTAANAIEYLPLPEAEAPEVLSLTQTSGELVGGDLIYIEGKNFDADLTVYFGNVEAKVNRVYGETKMYVTVPAGEKAGSVDVTVINPDGKSGTLADAYTYLEYVPEITDITETEGEMAGGNLLYINGKNFAADVEVYFGSEQATISKYYSAKRLYVKVPASAVEGTVDVTVVNGDGQSFTLKDAYTYLGEPELPPAVLTKITSSASATASDVTSIAKGKVLYLHGENFVETLQVKVVDAEGTEFIMAPNKYYSAVKMYIVVPKTAASGQASISVLSEDGTQESAAITFTIN